MKSFTSYLNAVEQHIEGSFNLGEAMQKFAPEYNKAKPEVQREFKDSLANLISIKKKVATITLEKGFWKGTLGFKAKQAGGTDASESARVMLNYYLPAKKVVEKASTKPKEVKKPNPVAKLLTQFKALTPAQRKAFLTSVTK